LVEVKYVRKLKRVISLDELKTHTALADMRLLRKGNRLSVMPVEPAHWQYILALETSPPETATPLPESPHGQHKRKTPGR
jgi:predicted RNA-binding protein with PUA-like domain